MTHVLALAAALPLALSHDVGGPLGLVALAPLMVLAKQVDQPFSHGFVCGFFEVFLTMWGASDYGLLIPITLALQGGLARGALAWAVHRGQGAVLPVCILVIGQGLRAASVLSLPLSTGHDLATMPWLAWPAAFGGGALLTAICGLCAYGLSHAAQRRQAGLSIGVLLALAGLHELLRPTAEAPIKLQASVIQGGLPNWVYRQASVDERARRLIDQVYLDVGAAEPPGRVLIFPETAVRETFGLGPMSAAYRAMHAKGQSLIAGVTRHVDGALRNSAMVWPRADAEPTFQSKRALVPIVEREFEALEDPALALPQGGRVQLCIESVYPRYSRGLEARWLLVLTNDAGVGRSTPRRAFERESRLRAIEMGRSLIRAGQDGRTYALSWRGKILAELPQYRPGVLRIDTLPGPSDSLRNWAGDWVFWLCWPLALVGLRRRLGAGAASA